jgi:hypothetical protein
MHCADLVLVGRSTCESLLVAEAGGLPRITAVSAGPDGGQDREPPATDQSGLPGAHRPSLAEGDLMQTTEEVSMQPEPLGRRTFTVREAAQVLGIGRDAT